MKNQLTAYCIFCLVTCVVAVSIGQADTVTTSSSNTYVVIGELITVKSKTSEEPVEQTDWSNASISITHEVDGGDGESQLKELASTKFENGKFTLSGEIQAPTDVTITASTGEEELSATALLIPGGEEISLVLVLNENEFPGDVLHVLGTSYGSQDPAQKLTIQGDFSDAAQNVNMATIGAYGQRVEDGVIVNFWLGHVMLDDGKFFIEADIAYTQVVYLYFWSFYGDDNVFALTPMIAEPNVNYTVSLRATDDMFVVSGKGRHAALVESWQQSTEYQKKFDAYEKSYLAFTTGQATKQDSPTQSAVSSEETETRTDAVVSSGETNTSESDSKSNVTIEHPEEPDALVDKTQSSSAGDSEECEHVVVAQPRRSTPVAFFSNETSKDEPEHVVLKRELTQIEDSGMQEILDDWSDPINVLLAMEWGAINEFDENRSDALKVYDKLAKQLDPEIVALRVTPARTRLFDAIVRMDAAQAVQRGQKVPGFTLANAKGEDVVLYDILAEREVTLLDFWASWCGPCIELFPHLKRLYTTYNAHGFEVIGVSLDDNFEDWNEAANEHSLPWINVSELKGSNGPVVKSYGISAIPQTFLVDEHGCVLQRNVNPELLESFLVQRYGEPDKIEPTESEDRKGI